MNILISTILNAACKNVELLKHRQKHYITSTNVPRTKYLVCCSNECIF